MKLDDVKQRVFDLADQINWVALSNALKAGYLDAWVEDPLIGGVLAELGRKPLQVRHYIKDTIIGEYNRERRIRLNDVMCLGGYDVISHELKTYTKPEAVLTDAGLFTITEAKAWKTALVNSWMRYKDEGCEGGNVLFVTQVAHHKELSRTPNMQLFKALCALLGVRFIPVN